MTGLQIIGICSLTSFCTFLLGFFCHRRQLQNYLTECLLSETRPGRTMDRKRQEAFIEIQEWLQ